MRKRKNNAFDTKSRYFSLVIFLKKSYKITESAKLKNIKVTVEHYFDVLYLNNGTEKIRSHGSVVKLPPPPKKKEENIGAQYFIKCVYIIIYTTLNIVFFSIHFL